MLCGCNLTSGTLWCLVSNCVCYALACKLISELNGLLGASSFELWLDQLYQSNLCVVPIDLVMLFEQYRL
jgi:hypothetical protein